jgi:hypothetical protein
MLNYRLYGISVLIEVLGTINLELHLFLIGIKNTDVLGRARIKIQAAYRFTIVVIHND